MYHACEVTFEARWGHWIPWVWSYRWLWYTCVLGIEPVSSGGATMLLTTEFPPSLLPPFDISNNINNINNINNRVSSFPCLIKYELVNTNITSYVKYRNSAVRTGKIYLSKDSEVLDQKMSALRLPGTTFSRNNDALHRRGRNLWEDGIPRKLSGSQQSKGCGKPALPGLSCMWPWTGIPDQPSQKCEVGWHFSLLQYTAQKAEVRVNKSYRDFCLMSVFI